MARIGRSRPVSNYKITRATSFAATVTVGLTTPNLSLVAPLLAPSAGATIALTTPNLALAGPTLTPSFSFPPFPQAPLDLDFDLYLGTTWTNVSTYVYQRSGASPPVSITRGKPNETETTDPSTVDFEENNQDGRFSPLNPVGPYYGQLQRNTFLRVSTQALNTYLRLENQDGTDSAIAQGGPATALNITGDLEYRTQIQLSDWTPCTIAGRWDSGMSWSLNLENSGCVTFWWTPDGSTTHALTSTAPVPFSRPQFALRVTFAVATGTATFYTASTIDGTYTQLGSAVVFGSTTSLFAGSGTPLEVGYSANWVANGGHGTPSSPTPYGAMHGRVFESRLYNGIGGTVVADGLFSGQVAGTTSWTDSKGISWAISQGAEINAREYRFHGQMSSQPPTWDNTGKDMAVQAQASGLLRLLGQGAPPPISAFKRGVSLLKGSIAPVIYWPMEDASGSSYFSPAIGTNLLTWGTGSPELASGTQFPCSTALPVMNNSAYSGRVPAYSGGTQWAVRFLTFLPTLPANNQVLFQVNCYGGLAAYVVAVVDSNGSFAITANDANLNVIADSGPVFFPFSSGVPLLWSMEATPSGSNVKYTLNILQPGASASFFTSATSSATGAAGFVGEVHPSPFANFSDTVMGHIFVQSTIDTLFDLASPLNAWSGEPAAQRYARACEENGYSARIVGAPAVSALMGYQGADPLQTILQECETADMGQMFECRDSASLGYRTLASMLNQTPVVTLDYSQATIGGTSPGSSDSGLQATYDDLNTRNNWTVTRGSSAYQGGSASFALNDGSAMSISPPPTGVGNYPSSKTINLAADKQLYNAAAWLTHLGTVNEARWPKIPLNLARPAMANFAASAEFLDIGDVIAITNTPNTVLFDPVGQIVLGPNEDLGAFFWIIEANGSPASVYNTAIYNSTPTGRYDTAGSQLTSGISNSATSFQVSTTSGPLWTTAGGDLPFDINIGGERMTVGAISGSSSPQTFSSITRSVNGVVKSHSADEDVRLWVTPVYAPI